MDQLDSASLLLLYLDDELPGVAREALERRLASDPALAGELEQLRHAQTRAFAALADLDRTDRLPVSSGVAVRRVSRAVNQWQVNRIVKSPKPARRGAPMPWWSYPSAAVAAMIVGFLVWSMHQPPGLLPADPDVQQNLRLAEVESNSLTDWLESGFEATADASADDALRGRGYGPDDLGVYFSREEMSW